ncbi:MAG: hypothetical protein LBH27_02310, partial [Endomicrobium sp.]|nr:hypothetical protein [Endomicrobium sp.]
MRKLRKIIFIIILSLLTSITTGPNLLTTYAFAYSDDRDGDDDYSDSDEDDDPNRDYDDGGPEDDDEDDYEDEDYLKDQALEYVFAHRNEDVSDCNNEDEDWTSLPYPNPKTVSKKIWPNRKESFEEREPSDENFDIVTDTIDGIPVTDASKVVKNLDDFFKYQEITKQPHHELMKTFDAEQIEGSDELKGVKLAVDSNRSDYLKYIYAYTYGKGYSKFKGLDANHTPYIKDMAKLWKMKKDSISYKNAKKMSKIEDQIDWGDLGIYKEKDKAYYEKFKEIRNKWKAENAFKEKMNSESLSDDDKEKIIEDKEVKDLIKDVIPFYPHVSDRRNKKILEYANKILNDKESYGKKIDLIDEFAAKETTTSNKNQRENDHQIIKRLIKIERLLEAGKKYEDVPYVTRSILGRFIDVVMEPDFSFDVKFRKIRTVKQMEEELKKFAKGCEIENKEYREEIKNLLKIIRLETDGLDPESLIKSKAILPNIYRDNENKELIKDTIKEGEREHFNFLAYCKLQAIYKDLVFKSNTLQRENDEEIYQDLEEMRQAISTREGYFADHYKRLNKNDYRYFRDKIVFACEPSGQVADRKVKTKWDYTKAWEKFMGETEAQDRENLKNYVKSLKKGENISEEKFKRIKRKCLDLLKDDKGRWGPLYYIAVGIVNGRA